MNIEERRLLSEFLQQLKQAGAAAKDKDAEALIAEAVREQPDALYLLVQKALLQEQALKTAKARILDLEDHLERSRNLGGSYLDSEFRGNARPAPSATGPLAGFLGTAAATAAGVAGGAFLFKGLESLLGHHDSGFLEQVGAGGIDKLTINEYYGTDDNEPEFLDSLDELAEDDFDPYEDEEDGSLSI